MGFYEVTLSNGQLHEVELVPSGPTWRAEVDGQEMTLRLLGACGDDGLWVEIDGEPVRIPWGPEQIASLHQAIEQVNVSVPTLPQRKAEAQPNKESTSIDSPISGVVLRYLAQVGECVVAGQPILVLEAMKMENIIRAPREGCVQSISFASGDTVRRNEELFRLAPMPPASKSIDTEATSCTSVTNKI